MKKLHVILFCCVLSTWPCNASPDTIIPVTGRAIYFSSYGEKFNIVFNVDAKNEAIFSGITIDGKDGKLEIESNELNIRDFSKLDKVELFKVAGKDEMYIRVVDILGNKGERCEDRLFFFGGNYLKRVTTKVDAESVATYSTKLKGKAEVPGYK